MLPARVVATIVSIFLLTMPCLSQTASSRPVATAPAAGPAETGSFRKTLKSGGVERTYILHLPPTYNPARKVPLVVLLHGGAGKGAQAAIRYTSVTAKADQEGFIVALPDSSTGKDKPGWYAHVNEADDDIVYVHDLIGYLKKTLAVDGDRVYVAGISAGALMSYRVGIALGNEIAGLCPVAGSLWWTLRDGKTAGEPPKAIHPLSVVVVHGQLDKNVPYDGATGPTAMGWSVPKSVGYWVAQNGCNPEPKKETVADGKVIKETYSGGKGGTEVVFYTIPDGSHGWPLGGRGSWINTNDVMWDFFMRDRPVAIHPVGGVFLDSQAVSCDLVHGNTGLEIHYTLDGTSPTMDSPAYHAAFQLKETATMIAAGFRDGNRVGPEAHAHFVKLALLDADKPAGATGPGLAWDYFEGNWQSVPDFASLAAIKSGTANKPELTMLGQENASRAVRFTGYLTVPKDGLYTFHSASDGDTKLLIGATVAIDSTDLNALADHGGTVGLKAGIHRLTLLFGGSFRAIHLALDYEGPGIIRQGVPAAALCHDVPAK